MKASRLIILTACVLAMLIAANGCTYGIHADNTLEDLPEIDPEAGIARELSVRLFFRLANEDCLVGITETVEVGTDERVEVAMVSALINEPEDLADGTRSPFPQGTRVVDVQSENNIHYVTLSSEFLSEELYYAEKAKADLLLSNGSISMAQYNRTIGEARGEMLMLRRLSLYAIVNTLTQLDDKLSVQVMVEQSDSTPAARLTRAQIGLNSVVGSLNVAVEPMGYLESVVATPMIIVQCAFADIASGDYENAYTLFARSTANGRGLRPAFEKAAEDMRSLGKLTKYDANAYLVDSSGTAVYVSATVEIERLNGSVDSIASSNILMFREDGLYKIDYDTFMNILRGNK